MPFCKVYFRWICSFLLLIHTYNRYFQVVWVLPNAFSCFSLLLVSSLCCTAVALVAFVSPDVAGVAKRRRRRLLPSKSGVAAGGGVPKGNFSNKMISYLGNRFETRPHTHTQAHFHFHSSGRSNATITRSSKWKSVQLMESVDGFILK